MSLQAAVESIVQWAAGDTKSVTAATSETSDAFTFNADAIKIVGTLEADNNGTPAAGDTVIFKAIVLAQGSDYSTVEHTIVLGAVDTNSEDPGNAPFEMPVGFKSMKIIAENEAGSNAITVQVNVRQTLAPA